MPYGKVFKLRIYGLKKLKAFFDYIYSSNSVLFLDRKKEKFKDYFSAVYGARGGRKKKLAETSESPILLTKENKKKSMTKNLPSSWQVGSDLVYGRI